MRSSKVVIIGSGPAGYTAAIYAARAKLEPVLYEGFFSGPVGGQLMTTTDVENFPGFPQGITGPKLVTNFREQAKRFGTTLLNEDVESVDLKQNPFVVKGKTTQYAADTIIVSTGAVARRLPIPGTGDDEFWQKGVTSCAVCDGAMPIFRDRPLFVIGGGDSAMEEALFLTKFASIVHIVHRRHELRASKIMADRALNHPKIKILWDSEVSKVTGDEVVKNIEVHNLSSGKLTNYDAAGLFFAVGHEPNTKFLKGQLTLHENGYIAVKPGTCQTNIEGVFAAGDVQDFTYRQAITSAGSGCMAALEAERWLAAKEQR